MTTQTAIEILQICKRDSVLKARRVRFNKHKAQWYCDEIEALKMAINSLGKQMNCMECKYIDDCFVCTQSVECETCKYNDNTWDSDECDSCCGAHSNYERAER